MNFKNTEISSRSIAVIIFAALALLGLLGYWFINSFDSRPLSGPEGIVRPTLPPPELTAEEKARIQESINAPIGKQILSEKEMIKTLESLTAPKK